VADIVATGIPLAIPVTANKALEVDIEPSARSTVLEKGDTSPEFNCHKLEPVTEYPQLFDERQKVPDESGSV
jgi:hypothetical protein